MLDQKCIDSIIKLRDWLLENKELVENHLDFDNYCTGLSEESILPIDTKYTVDTSIRHNIKTTCCPLGWAAYSQLFDIRGKEDYYSFIKANFSNLEDVYPYLFSTNNENNFDEMIERFNYVVNGQSPISFKVVLL